MRATSASSSTVIDNVVTWPISATTSQGVSLRQCARETIEDGTASV
jgi:hypothetical protein